MLPLKTVILLVVSCGFSSVAGCGRGDYPELGYVTGTVTMDGEPVSDMLLFFKPDVGRAATARTNEDGFYRLEYVKGVSGTKLGPTIVLLEWPLGHPAPFAIPTRYTGAKTELKLDVQKGKNAFDVKMVSDPKDSSSKANSLQQPE